MNFVELNINDKNKIAQMSDLATQIVREHYDPILGTTQNDYMLERFQSEKAIKNQLENGYRYYFVVEENQKIGFMAFYPRGNSMYLSKFYLHKNFRGKGYSRKMLEFVVENAKKEGLTSVELNVNKYNSSVYVYQKLGFKQLRAEKIDIGSGYYMDDFVYGMNI